jgi:hypothetical protein
MCVVDSDFVDKAHLPTLRDHFSAPIAVALNLRRAAKSKKYRASARRPTTLPMIQMFD